MSLKAALPDPADRAVRPADPGPRRLNAHSCLRFRHWRLYGERGLAGERSAVWVWDETVTIEYVAETLAEYPVAFEADRRQLREVGAPASTQPDTPRTSRSSPIWKRSSGSRRNGWRPTGRVASGNASAALRSGAGGVGELSAPVPVTTSAPQNLPYARGRRAMRDGVRCLVHPKLRRRRERGRSVGPSSEGLRADRRRRAPSPG